MISYGDSGFRQWAEENNFNDADIALMRKTTSRRAWLWAALFLGFPAIFSALIGTDAAICGIIPWMIFSPLLLEAWMFSCVLKQGTFDNVRGPFLWKLLYLCMFITFIYIWPLVFWKLAKKRMWGTGFKKLVKKGLIGQH